MTPRRTIRHRLFDVFFSEIELDAGPIRKLRIRALVIIILIPMLVAAACVLKYYGVI